MNNYDLIKSAFKKISPPGYLTERIIGMEYKKRNKKLCSMKKLTTVIVAAAAVIILGGVGAATGIFDFNKAFESMGVTAETEFGSRIMGSFKNFTYECTEGYKIEPIAVSATVNRLLLTIDVYREDGKDFDPYDIQPERFSEGIFINGEDNKGGADYNRVISPTDPHHKRFTYNIDATYNCISDETDVRILQLKEDGSTDGNDNELYYDISFTVITGEGAKDYKVMSEESVTLAVPFEVSINSEFVDNIILDVTYTDIRVDPAGLYMCGSYVIPEEYQGLQYNLNEASELKCILADGTEYPITTGKRGSSSYIENCCEFNFTHLFYEGNEYDYTEVFKDISGAVAVSVNGTKINLISENMD